MELSIPCQCIALSNEQECLPAAQPIADIPGLRWKIWLMKEKEQTAGGTYLFENEAALQSYMAGPILAAMMVSHVLAISKPRYSICWIATLQSLTIRLSRYSGYYAMIIKHIPPIIVNPG